MLVPTSVPCVEIRSDQKYVNNLRTYAGLFKVNCIQKSVHNICVHRKASREGRRKMRWGGGGARVTDSEGWKMDIDYQK